MISYFLEFSYPIPTLELVSAEVATTQKHVENAIGVLVQASLAGSFQSLAVLFFLFSNSKNNNH